MQRWENLRLEPSNNFLTLLTIILVSYRIRGTVANNLQLWLFAVVEYHAPEFFAG